MKSSQRFSGRHQENPEQASLMLSVKRSVEADCRLAAECILNPGRSTTLRCRTTDSNRDSCRDMPAEAT